MKNWLQFSKGILFSAFLFAFYFVFPNILAFLFVKLLSSENIWINNLACLAIYAITLLLILLIVRKDIFKEWKSFISEPKKYLNKGFSYWVYGIIVMMISNLVINSLVGNISVNEQEIRQLLLDAPLYAIPTIIFFGPFIEELVFRYGLRKAFNKKISFALFSGAIFGLLHIFTALDNFTISNILAHASEFLFIVPYGSLGFFFAEAYYETENIFSSVIPHILHNTLSVILILIVHFIGG